MTVKKFGLGSLFLLLISATSTGLTSQPGSAAASQAHSYSPVRQTICGCRQRPDWEERIKSIYRSHIYCPDVSSVPGSASHTIYCPDFRKSSKIPTSTLETPVHLAYDPDAREAAREAAKDARDAARGHSPREVLDAAGRGIDRGEVLGGMAGGAAVGGRILGGPGIAGGAAMGGTAAGISGAVRGVHNYCTGCHSGGGRNRNPN